MLTRDKIEMEAAKPEITFVSELEVIIDFMGDQNFFDDNEDFEKELVDIFLEVSYSAAA